MQYFYYFWYCHIICMIMSRKTKQKRVIVHLEINGEHHYFGNLKALTDEWGKDTIGVSYNYLKSLHITSDRPFQNNKCTIRKGIVLSSPNKEYDNHKKASRAKYDYDTCYEIARSCSSSSEMQKKNGSAYNVARKNKWIADYDWFILKRHKPYTYDEVFEIAKLYSCSSEFQKGNGSAYGKARANGWIKDYTWFNIKQHSPYMYDECYQIAKDYHSRLELAKGNIGVYQAALNHGWLDDYTWFESRQKPYNYWTKERVLEESKKYKTRGEFHDGCGTAYGKARINGWLDECLWLKDDRIDFSHDKVDCVYAYEFKEYNAVYIGRTLRRRLKDRDKEHLYTDTDAVYLFARKHNISIPEIIVLEDNLTLAEGVEKEGYYLEDYRKRGWETLNRAKTGGIGLIARNKWSKRTCYEEALRYKTRGAFAKNSSRAYDVARRSGWLDNYTWFEEQQKPSGYWDSYSNCFEAASQCRTKTEFIKKYNAAYVSAREHGWIKQYTWFVTKRTPSNKKWNYDTVYAEANKYKTKKEFGTNARGAYKAALSNGWMEDYDWFEDTHSVLSKAIKASKRIKWTYEVCKQLSNEANGRLDFRKKSPGAYHASWKNKWLDDFFPKD